MIGGTLFWYFSRRFLVTALQLFAGITIIIFLVDFTEFARRTSSHAEYTVQLGLLASALRIPLILQTAIPFMVMIAAMVTLTALNRRYELVIARASGVSAWQFLAPLLFVSFSIGIFSVMVFNPLSATALASAQEIESRLVGGGAARSGGNEIPWLRQRTEEGTTIIGAAHTARRGQLLSDATFIELDEEGQIRRRIDAKHAELMLGRWELQDVTLLRRGNTPERIDTMQIPTNLDPTFVEERFTVPEIISIYELPRKIAASRSFGMSGNSFSTHFHSLLALPFFLAAMTLIAATVTMRFARMGQPIYIILGGILAGFLLYVLTAVMRAFGGSGIVPPLMAAWLPVFIAGFYGVTFLLYKEDG
ncbi:LPS export ABC transporter permease LptG [Chelativorans sp. ZYF759]|uniref:LPS export ABC transporter permease LptG n=1 Tax=Chelativorans sp. ZYF759 TaxID=2692213 RepID=UPI00145C9833|nr:LPS export ABC transporter permease LptG [Chelativorans sp. ZYF759]NMG38736.1 LPS export ABC transporter permease LptG [Chelativorans sp. ZYF759]